LNNVRRINLVDSGVRENIHRAAQRRIWVEGVDHVRWRGVDTNGGHLRGGSIMNSLGESMPSAQNIQGEKD
jgi:hypothetical protein